MQIDGGWLTAGLAAIAAVVWLVRLEGRVNGHDTEQRQLRADITYIRDRIDRALEQD